MTETSQKHNDRYVICELQIGPAGRWIIRDESDKRIVGDGGRMWIGNEDDARERARRLNEGLDNPVIELHASQRHRQNNPPKKKKATHDRCDCGVVYKKGTAHTCGTITG